MSDRFMGLLKDLNDAKLCGACYAEDDVDLGDAEEVATVDLDEHRWYVIGTVVYRVGERFLGIRGPVSLKSESMGFTDIGEACEAFEMEEVPSVSYKRKVGEGT